jgi:hypothetical protein
MEDLMKSLFIPAFLLLASCGNSGPGGISSSFNEVFEKLKESAPELSSSKSLPLIYREYVQDKSINAGISLWNNATASFSGLGSTSMTIKGYVTNMFDQSQDQSIFERARMPFLISCCLDILANKTGDSFTTGSQTITFTSEVIGVCGQASDFTGMIGNNITIVVSNTTDTTYYDQKIFFNHTTNPLFSDSDQWMFVRNNSSVLNFMHVEDTSSGFDGSQISVNSISYNKTTQDGYFQFATKYTTNDAKLYRIYMDAIGDDSRIYAYTAGNLGGPVREATMNVASTFDNQTYAALSMSYASQNAPYGTDVTDVKACIDTSDSSIETDNTSTCAGNGKTVLDSSGADAIETAVRTLNGGTVRSNAISGALEDNLPAFTDTTILSAGIQIP